MELDAAASRDELSGEALKQLMPRRPLRFYSALVSTDAEAQAWARTDAVDGALVVADHQLAARGRAGSVWPVNPGRGIAFSLIKRWSGSAAEEGWLYLVASAGLADEISSDTSVVWPDEVHRGGVRTAMVQAHTVAGTAEAWAVLSVLVERTDAPRAPHVAACVASIEHWYRADAEELVATYRARCRTLGEDVRARLVPLGPAGPEVSGRATGLNPDGALVLVTDGGRRVAVRPHHVAVLEPR